jgi:hypothetical protein
MSANELQLKVQTWMEKQLAYNCKEYDDCGEINYTLLAETAASEFELYENGDYDDAVIPEWVFDLSVDVGEGMFLADKEYESESD